MQIKVSHGMDDFSRDLRAMVAAEEVAVRGAVRKNAREGANLARRYASQQHSMNSRYDIHYPRSITWDQPRSFYGFGGGGVTAEYGPDPARPQGGMSFERGSRNQPPHLDLAKSADVVAVQFGPNVLYAVNRVFWGER